MAVAASAAACNASSQSSQPLTGNTDSSVSPVVGFCAWNVPTSWAGRQLPLIRTGWEVMALYGLCEVSKIGSTLDNGIGQTTNASDVDVNQVVGKQGERIGDNARSR